MYQIKPPISGFRRRHIICVDLQGTDADLPMKRVNEVSLMCLQSQATLTQEPLVQVLSLLDIYVLEWIDRLTI